MVRMLERLVGALAVFALGLSLLVHGLTFAHIDVITLFPKIWLMHFGCLIGGVPITLILRQRLGKNYSINDISSILPRWAFILLMAAFFYAIANFVMFIILSEGGSPLIREGKFVLQSHGTFIRELTENEYHIQRAYVMRCFSGFWLLIYLLQVLYFFFRVPETSKLTATDQPKGPGVRNR